MDACKGNLPPSLLYMRCATNISDIVASAEYAIKVEPARHFATLLGAANHKRTIRSNTI